MSRLAYLLLGLMLIAGIARAATGPNIDRSIGPDPAQTAKQAAQMLTQAAHALRQAKRARDRVSALSETVRAYEQGLSALREGLRQSAIRAAALRHDLAAKRARISKLLGVLASIERNPAPLLILHPAGPLAAVRSGMILADITPALQSKAKALRQQLRELSLMDALQSEARSQLAAGLSGVQTARSDLSQAIADRIRLPTRFGADEARLATLAQQSKSLEGFAAGLARMAHKGPKAELRASFAAARGKLELPVPGILLRHYNEPDAAGISRPGLVYAVAPQALVTSPWTATIRYRGPLLDYGDVIVLEPGEGYLLVLAGLGEVYGEVGEIVERGAPVGLMGGKQPSAPEFLADATKGGGIRRPETLYMELRESGKPIDPTQWFAVNRE